MDQLFDPDSLSAAMERGHVFERQASVPKRPERRTPGP